MTSSVKTSLQALVYAMRLVHAAFWLHRFNKISKWQIRVKRWTTANIRALSKLLSIEHFLRAGTGGGGGGDSW